MTGAAPGHAHAWAGMRFEMRDGHPWVVETCEACGLVRRYRAFERSWDPSAGREHDRQPTTRPAGSDPGPRPGS